ncbi:MAG: hypothetical protein KKF44_09685 [Nanoarchaeota archaeon]|nr:hypothetical protein [Nanoarchaeota archaeon]
MLREYPTIEPGEPFFGLDQLKNGPPEEIHSEYHSQIVLCVDYLILKTPEGVILGKSEPVSGTEMLWPIGGLLKRGYETESSVRESVPEGWQISDIKPIGPARLFFSDDPFGKDKGTDVLAMGYVGNLAEIPADLGSNYQYVPRTDFRTLHPFIQDMLDL